MEHLEIPHYMEIPSSGATTPSTASSPGYPPSYRSDAGWLQESEKEYKQPEENIRPIQFLKTRATTFGTLTGNEIKDKYGKAKRFITRSGTDIRPMDEVNQSRSYLQQRFSGWRGGVLASVISAGCVLFINLIFTIWAAAKSKSGMSIGLIYEDECSRIHTAGLWIHIVINVLGTVLLGSSNYTMQCLSSPTRKEVDEAHTRGKYLDIGLPSFRNLRGWRKKSLFTMLVISTIPLHFLWNSAVFTTTQQLDYQVFVVTPNFLTQSTVDCQQNVTISNRISGPSSDPYFYYFRTQLNGSGGATYSNTRYNANSRNYTVDYSQPTISFPYTNICSTGQELRDNSTLGRLQRLSNSECITAYGAGDGLMKNRGNLLAVTKGAPPPESPYHNNTVLLNLRYENFVSNYTGNNWVCDSAMLNANDYDCDWRKLAKAADEQWNLGEIIRNDEINRFRNGEQWEVDYCLSQSTDLGGTCQLQYSLVIMLCVLFANMTKFGVIFYFLYSAHDPVLATIGDGIASFLERPDAYTTGRPFLTRRHGRKFKVPKLDDPPPRPVPFKAPRPWQRWWSAPSLARWTITLSLCITVIGIAASLLQQGNRQLSSNSHTHSPYSLGFGNYNADATIRVKEFGTALEDFTSNSNLIMMVAIANIPQVLVSFLYFAYNVCYTSMVSADEWARFTTHRKTLRTSNPIGGQRSTYWLSLPWTYALPLATASSVLHWLISQSLFVSRTIVLDPSGESEPLSFMEIGYSPIAILVALLFGSTMVIAMILNGARSLKGGYLVANNSLAIAAACQRPEDDKFAHMKPVRWGALKIREKDGTWKEHCCFTSQEVDPPEVDKLYI